MSTTISFNGVSYTIPSTKETGWGTNVKNYLSAISTGTLQPVGGLFTLTNNVNFGPNAGLLAKFYGSRSANLASAGILRLAVSDTIQFRNNANNGNMVLSVNGSNQLVYSGAIVATGFVGNIIGNIVGQLTGNVIGNVLGDLTGNVTGDVLGNVTGDVVGDLNGNVTGDLLGNVTGDVTGDVLGNLTGNVLGNVVGNLTGNVTGNVSGTSASFTGNLTGPVTSVGMATSIALGVVTNAMLANMAANSIKGNNTGAPAASLDLTATQVTAMLNTFTSGLKGLVPASGGGTTTFLRADGVFAALPGSGTVTSVSVTSGNGFAGSVATSTTTPAITISTTINSPVLAGDGTAISGATVTGTGSTVVLNDSPVLITPDLGVPSALDASNATGTAPGLTAGTVTTNADLTGPISSTGNTTSITSQTGTGSKFVVDTSPVLVTPDIGAASATSLQVSGLTASQAVATDASKNLVSVPNTGTGNNVLSNSPSLVTPALDTPSFLLGTNITGTAAGLTAGAVTTNANLTGPITSVGNATSIASQTGTGTKFVVDTSPTLVTPNLGTPSALVGTNITGTASALNIGGNAATATFATSAGSAGTVTTNANLTGPITSVGNATSIASQTGTGTKFVVDTSPTLVTPNLGTPSALVGTNITGTAAGLTAGNVTTNANLTGPITSVGNATSIASQTGTGTKFVVDTSPTLVTPNIGVASGTSLATTGTVQSGGTSITTALALGGVVSVANNNTNNLISVGYGSGAPGIKGFRASGSELSPIAPTPGVTTVSLEGHCYDGTSFNVSTPHASIVSQTTETQSATAHGSKIVFSTTPNTTTSLTQAFSLENDGKGVFVSTASAINFLAGYSTTATASGTTVLTAASNQQQYFTGSLNQTVTLPVASTLGLGFSFIITNNSSGIITIQSSGANTVTTVAASSQVTVVCILASGTTAASWSFTSSGGTITTTPTATTNAAWDANKNLSANSHIDGFTTTATGAGTTTLVVGSTKQQIFTGTNTQTVVLPTTSIVAGQQFIITNSSTGVVTVQSSGANTIQAMPSGSVLTVTALVATPTTAANWGAQMTVNGLLLGTSPTVQKLTSGTTYTTPAGVQYIKVTCVGGGNTGGSSGATAGGGGGGGGAGGAAIKWITNPAASYTYAIGAAGGGTTSFGSSLCAASGGTVGGATSPGTGTPCGGASGAGGVGTFGDILLYGGPGVIGGTTINGVQFANGGPGGNAPSNYGGGGGAIGYGGGGGGGAAGGAGTAGIAGVIIVEEYYPNTAVSSVLVGVTPNVVKYTSGSGNYTPSAGVQYIKFRMVGAGGGGGGSGTAGTGSAGTGGGSTTFGTSTAGGGNGGSNSNQGGSPPISGGSATLGSGILGTAIPGGTGNGTIYSNIVGWVSPGSKGGDAPFFGGAGYGDWDGGNAGIANTGGGGSSGGIDTTGTYSGKGGGAGGYVEGIINAPGTIAYSIGVGGPKGNLGTTGYDGAVGGSGYLEITEYFTNLAVGTQSAIPANQIMAGPSSGASAFAPTFRAMTAYDTAISGYDTSTATSGTITAATNRPGLVVNSAGGTTLIVLLPPTPLDGQVYYASSVGAFTTVTWKDAGGTAGNVIGGQSAWGGTNRGQTFVYSSALTKWLATS